MTFNNILQPILGYSELMREELSADSELRHYAEGIYNSSLRAKELVTQILTFSRQTEHKSYPLRIHTILKEVFKLSRSAIPTNIILVQDIDEKCPPVLINPTQMHQVAMNLIVNGYHAVEQTGGEDYHSPQRGDGDRRYVGRLIHRTRWLRCIIRHGHGNGYRPGHIRKNI